MPRYFMRISPDGVEVYDSSTGDANDAEIAVGPDGPLERLSWDGANRIVYEMNRAEHEKNNFSFLSDAPSTPCPDCVRYRAALNEIARTAVEVHILRLANELLDTGGGE